MTTAQVSNQQAQVANLQAFALNGIVHGPATEPRELPLGLDAGDIDFADIELQHPDGRQCYVTFRYSGHHITPFEARWQQFEEFQEQRWSIGDIQHTSADVRAAITRVCYRVLADWFYKQARGPIEPT